MDKMRPHLFHTGSFLSYRKVFKVKKKKKATMADVAAAVGVSKTTVSRYLHGDYQFMSEETRKKIQTVIEEMNYRPNRAAQNLKADRSNCIGFTIADIGNPFSSLLIKGVQAECRKRGCQLLIADADNSILQEKNNIESFFNEQVDGMIVNSVGNNGEFIKNKCEGKENKPMVLLDRTYRPVFCDSIVSNNEEITMQMMQELGKCGWKHIVFTSETTEGISTRAIRREAVEKFLLENKEVSGDILILNKENRLDGMAKLAEILNFHPKTCFFANNDEILRKMLSYLYHMNQEIGKDVGLCAFADEKWAKYSGPGITCIEQHPFQMGEEAAALLFQKIEGKKETQIVYKEIQADICKYDSTSMK